MSALNQCLTGLVDAALSDTVLVSSDRHEPARGWVYLRLVADRSNTTLQVSLSAESAQELAHLLELHASRVKTRAPTVTVPAAAYVEASREETPRPRSEAREPAPCLDPDKMHGAGDGFGGSDFYG